jgi:hypothetical protein
LSDNGRRYVFSGHAIGAAAQFHRLDELTDLNHVIPTLGASVLPVTGGLSHSNVSNYCYRADKPRKRHLLSVRNIETRAAGNDYGDRFETEVHSVVSDIEIVEKLHIEHVEMHLIATRDLTDGHPAIRTKGNKIEGLRLGNVEARITLDESALSQCGTKKQLAEYYRNLSKAEQGENAWRFNTAANSPEIQEHSGHFKCTLVKSIELIGPDDEKKNIKIEGGYKIYWPGFGRIVLGEVLVGERSRRITLVRLAMGSDAGGSGTIGEGEGNGHISK